MSSNTEPPPGASDAPGHTPALLLKVKTLEPATYELTVTPQVCDRYPCQTDRNWLNTLPDVKLGSSACLPCSLLPAAQLTVQELKTQLEGLARDAPATRQRIIFRGRPLQDGSTMQQLGKRRRALARGGACSGKGTSFWN